MKKVHKETDADSFYTSINHFYLASTWRCTLPICLFFAESISFQFFNSARFRKWSTNIRMGFPSLERQLLTTSCHTELTGHYIPLYQVLYRYGPGSLSVQASDEFNRAHYYSRGKWNPWLPLTFDTEKRVRLSTRQLYAFAKSSQPIYSCSDIDFRRAYGTPLPCLLCVISVTHKVYTMGCALR